jgi:NDP-sugar pyrophosphorylase family protein
MTVLITMAGLGSRFSQNGYTVPKYKITARGRTLFEWSLLSLKDYFDQPFVLVTLGVDDRAWLLDSAAKLGIKHVTFCPRTSLSKGQAETANDALEAVAQGEPLWVYNIDTYVARGLSPAGLAKYDGCLPVYPSHSPGMSFVRFDAREEVVQVAEKQVISNWATVGLYGFKTANMYGSVYAETYRNYRGAVGMKEQYIAPMYDYMLQSGLLLSAPRLDANAVNVLGTPKEVLAFDPDAKAPKGSPENGTL